MSNGNGGNNCGEIVYNNGYFYILDTKDADQNRNNPVGTLAIYSRDEYDERVAKVKLTGDARELFATPEEYRSFDPDEMSAIAAYAGKGALDSVLFEDGYSIVARQSRSDIEEARPESAQPMLAAV